MNTVHLIGLLQLRPDQHEFEPTRQRQRDHAPRAQPNRLCRGARPSTRRRRRDDQSASANSSATRGVAVGREMDAVCRCRAPRRNGAEVDERGAVRGHDPGDAVVVGRHTPGDLVLAELRREWRVVEAGAVVSPLDIGSDRVGVEQVDRLSNGREGRHQHLRLAAAAQMPARP
jgi:hypothetical protein